MSGCPLPLSTAELRSFRRTLLRWYDRNRRDLPWRHDRDPYRVWISEIMLQQTRVAAVLDHYARFLRRFPTVQSLASAREASVLAVWSGLGYYHRARRMHQAAMVIVRERNGRFPQTADEWSELPGIGRYTASAIASIALGEPVSLVDGNVERVLERLFPRRLTTPTSAKAALVGDPGKSARDKKNEGRETAQLKVRPELAEGLRPCKTSFSKVQTRSSKVETREEAWRRAERLLDRTRPGDFNQAMMELGATICTPRAPECPLCPLSTFCKSRGADGPRVQAARKRKEVSYALVRKNSSVALVRRPAESSLMAGMWELPAIHLGQMNGNRPLLRLRHSITDTDYRVEVFAVPPDQLLYLGTEARWVSRKQWEQLPLTGLTRKILRHLPLASSRGEGESKCG